MTTPRSLFRRSIRSSLVRAQGDAVDLLIYDEIGFFGITAKQVADELANIDADTIHLRVNSPGGDVFDGVAIHNALKQHPARIVTHIDGLAASIASVIALAGDEVVMAPNAFFMIHNPWGITIGDADDHRKMADTLDKIAMGAIANTYKARTGLPLETIERWMDEETWFDGEQAKEAGFADVVEEAAPAEARVLPFDLSIYQRVPTGLRYAVPDDETGLTGDEWREIEATLRDEGFSWKDAKKAISCLKHWCQRDADTPSTPPRDEAGAAPERPDAALAVLQAITATWVADTTAIHTRGAGHVRH